MSDSAARPNRRLTARTACHLTVRYHAHGEWRPAIAMDVSRQGCRLRVGEDIPRGATVAVLFQAASGQGEPIAVEVSGTVVWSRFEGLSHQSGIHFVHPPPALDRLLTALQ